MLAPYKWDTAEGRRPARRPFRFLNSPLPLTGFPSRAGAWLSGQSTPDFFAYIVSTGSVAPGGTAVVNLQIQDDAAFELIALTGLNLAAGATVWQQPQTCSQWLVSVQDLLSDRHLFLSNIVNSANPFPNMTSLNNILGSATFPHVLPVPRRFMRQSGIQFTFYNIDSAVTSQWQFALMGRKIFTEGVDQSLLQAGQIPRFRTWRGRDGRIYQEDYFGYNFSINTLAAGNTIDVPIQIESFSDFEAVQLTAAMPPRNLTTGNIIANNTGLLNMQLSDGASQRRLLSAAAPIGLFFGQGQQPFELPQTRVFPATNSVKLSITNTDVDPYSNMNFLFEGRKIFGMG